MLFNELNEDNFLLFAIRNYENPQAVTKEDFDRDLNHFKYIKRLLKRYKNTGQLKTHLLLNHFIILYNIFGEATETTEAIPRGRSPNPKRAMSPAATLFPDGLPETKITVEPIPTLA